MATMQRPPKKGAADESLQPAAVPPKPAAAVAASASSSSSPRPASLFLPFSAASSRASGRDSTGSAAADLDAIEQDLEVMSNDGTPPSAMLAQQRQQQAQSQQQAMAQALHLHHAQSQQAMSLHHHHHHHHHHAAAAAAAAQHMTAQLAGLKLVPQVGTPRGAMAPASTRAGVAVGRPRVVPPPPYFLTQFTVPVAVPLGELRGAMEGALRSARVDFEFNPAKWKAKCYMYRHAGSCAFVMRTYSSGGGGGMGGPGRAPSPGGNGDGNGNGGGGSNGNGNGNGNNDTFLLELQRRKGCHAMFRRAYDRVIVQLARQGVMPADCPAAVRARSMGLLGDGGRRGGEGGGLAGNGAGGPTPPRWRKSSRRQRLGKFARGSRAAEGGGGGGAGSSPFAPVDPAADAAASGGGGAGAPPADGSSSCDEECWSDDSDFGGPDGDVDAEGGSDGPAALRLLLGPPGRPGGAPDAASNPRGLTDEEAVVEALGTLGALLESEFDDVAAPAAESLAALMRSRRVRGAVGARAKAAVAAMATAAVMGSALSPLASGGGAGGAGSASSSATADATAAFSTGGGPALVSPPAAASSLSQSAPSPSASGKGGGASAAVATASTGPAAGGGGASSSAVSPGGVTPSRTRGQLMRAAFQRHTTPPPVLTLAAPPACGPPSPHAGGGPAPSPAPPTPRTPAFPHTQPSPADLAAYRLLAALLDRVAPRQLLAVVPGMAAPGGGPLLGPAYVAVASVECRTSAALALASLARDPAAAEVLACVLRAPARLLDAARSVPICAVAAALRRECLHASWRMLTTLPPAWAAAADGGVLVLDAAARTRQLCEPPFTGQDEQYDAWAGMLREACEALQLRVVAARTPGAPAGASSPTATTAAAAAHAAM